jgi:hypothetical protein
VTFDGIESVVNQRVAHPVEPLDNLLLFVLRDADAMVKPPPL